MANENASGMVMGDVKFGRNSDETVIRQQMENILKGLASYMTGARYNSVIATIRKNWVGKDADEFIKNFEAKVASMKAELPKRYTERYVALVKQNVNLFNSEQAKNSANLKF